MIIEIEKDSQIVIKLNNKEMNDYGITLENIKGKDLKTLEIIQEWVFFISIQLGLLSGDNSFVIEAFKLEDGCIIKINMINKKNEIKKYKVKFKKNISNYKIHTPFIYEISNPDDLLDIICKLYKKPKKIPSGIYIMKNKYYLLLYLHKVPQKLHILIIEYAKFVGKAKLMENKLLEYAKPLIPENAIYNIGYHLVKRNKH